MVGHHLWIYIKDNYSVKKTKDLVGSQIQKYKTILNDIQEAEAEAQAKKEKERLESVQNEQSQLVMYNSESNYVDLKNDLEHFLQELKDIQ
jgi:thiamine biosynthesis lipoprotein ApbE